MTVVNPPANLQNRTDHTAQMDRLAIEGLLRTSFAALGTTSAVRMTDGNDLKVTQTGVASMGVIVKAGGGYVEGTDNTNQGVYFVYNDGDVTLSLAASNPSNPRKDAVVFTVRDAFYAGANNDSLLQVITGTASSSPVLPALPNNSLLLGEVLVGAAVTSVTNGNITDRRVALTTASESYQYSAIQVLAPNYGDFNSGTVSTLFTLNTINIPTWAQDGNAVVDIIVSQAVSVITSAARFEVRVGIVATPGAFSGFEASSVPHQGTATCGITYTIPAGTTSIAPIVQGARLTGTGALRCSNTGLCNAYAMINIHR